MDEIFMKRCLELASLGFGSVAPNPQVGCVIVHGDQIIGEGYHQKYGEAHAEVNAINSVADRALLSTSTLYVNLEPCNHIGKTPACSGLILDTNIPKVVIGSIDSNSEVQGGGAEHLRQSGVEVVEGILEVECLEFNRRFFVSNQERRPYVILKWAQSGDGFIAPEGEQQQWITGDEAKELVHKWRTEEQAILVGTNTVLIDNPTLTARLWEGKNPLRVTIDNEKKIPLDSHIFNSDADTIVYSVNGEGSGGNVLGVRVEGGDEQLGHIFEDLYQRGISSVLVEGGARLLTNLISDGLWDEARVFTGVDNFGKGIKAPVLNSDSLAEEQIGDDHLRLFKRNS